MNKKLRKTSESNYLSSDDTYDEIIKFSKTFSDEFDEFKRK